jgi:CHASE3 domain sensor protein
MYISIIIIIIIIYKNISAYMFWFSIEMIHNFGQLNQTKTILDK